MSDDGTKAAKKIAYSIQVDGCLAQLDYLLKQMLSYGWAEDDERKLSAMSKSVEDLHTDARDLVDSFFKVIGEA